MAMSATSSFTVTTILAGSPPTDVSGGWIAITIPKAVLILTPEELKTAQRRGKFWQRSQQLAARLQAAEADR